MTIQEDIKDWDIDTCVGHLVRCGMEFQVNVMPLEELNHNKEVVSKHLRTLQSEQPKETFVLNGKQVSREEFVNCEQPKAEAEEREVEMTKIARKKWKKIGLTNCYD